MFVCCECCVLSGRGLCDELIMRPEKSYRLWCVVVCDLEASRMRRPWPALGRSATREKKCTVLLALTCFLACKTFAWEGVPRDTKNYFRGFAMEKKKFWGRTLLWTFMREVPSSNLKRVIRYYWRIYLAFLSVCRWMPRWDLGLSTTASLEVVSNSLNVVIYDVFVNCNWVDARWQ